MNKNGVTVYGGGTEIWRKNGRRHREDGPAVVGQREEEWWVEGRIHRTDGPAIIYYDTNEVQWWINDEMIACNKEYQLQANLSDEDMLSIVLKYGPVKLPTGVMLDN